MNINFLHTVIEMRHTNMQFYNTYKYILNIYQEVYAHQQQSLAKINAPVNHFKLDVLKLKALIAGTIKWINFGKCDQIRK